MYDASQRRQPFLTSGRHVFGRAPPLLNVGFTCKSPLPCVILVSQSQTVTLAVTVWTTAVERFVLGSPGSRVGDKCERYRKGHESHYIRATPSVEYSTLHRGRWVMSSCPLRYRSHLSPTLLPGELRTKRSTAVVQTATASVRVWLRETSVIPGKRLKACPHWTSNAHSMRIGCVHNECALNRSGLNAH